MRAMLLSFGLLVVTDREYLTLKSAKRIPARFPLASIESVEVEVFENR